MADPNSGKSDRWDSNETLSAGSNGLVPGGRLEQAAVQVRTPSPSTFSFAPDDVAAGRFKIIRFVARGGMGEVYEAEDLELKERVALKTVRLEMAQQGHAIERFRREIQLARKVTHPNVCRTFDVFRHAETDADRSSGEILVVSMELLAGETLEQRIRRTGRLSPAEALPIVVQRAAGLQAAHQAGVVHRDFKSSNIILVSADDYPGKVRAVTTDFGLARADTTLSGQSLTSTNDLLGTPAYMAPEQLQGGEITPETDIYALGVVMFQMVTGALPFMADTPLATALKRLSEAAPSPRKLVSDLDPKWEQAILRCLELEPTHRFAGTPEVVQTLTGGAVPLALRLPQAWRRSRLFILCAAVILLASAVIGYFGLRYRFQVSSKSRPSIAVLGFRNMAGGKESVVSGDELAEDLRSQLDTGSVHIISPAKVDEVRHELASSDDGSVGLADLRKLHDLLDCDYVVTGSYAVEGNESQREVVWNIHIDRTVDGERQGTVVERQLASTWSPSVVTDAGIEVEGKLNITVPASEVARLHGTLPTDVRASNDLAQGRQKLADFDIHGAIALFEQAVQEDPNYAQAHSALAEAWSELGYDEKARGEAKTALDLAGGLSRDTHDLIQARYDEMSHDWESASALYSSLWNDPATRESEYGLMLARSQTNGGKAADALKTLDAVRKGNPVPGIQAQADLAEAGAQADLAQYEEQLKSATMAAKEAQVLGTITLLARARVLQCLAELDLGEPSRADLLCGDARKLNETSGDKLGTARAINAIANAMYSKGDYAQASPLYEQALAIARSIGDKFDEAGALNNLAIIRTSMGDHKGAESLYRDSMSVARERGDNNNLALAEQNLAAALYQQGHQRGAEEMYGAAIQTAREIGAKNIEARILNNECMVAQDVGELKKALEDCQESLKLRKEAGDKDGMARSLQNAGRVFLYQGNFAEAKRNYEQALSIEQALDARDDEAYSKLLLAEVSVVEKQADAARVGADEARKEFAADGDKDSEAEARKTLAEALLESGDLAGAREQIAQASKLAQQADDRNVTFEAQIVAARIDAKTGKTSNAIQALETIQKKARTASLVAIEFEARLALGESEIEAGRVAEGRAVLGTLSDNAKAKGFGYIAETAKKES
jgi:tetratricopeptide (TPR) repeat protein/tRNA A-37 threonylcarbamoyl transferase component Bud32/TolB-like protein